MNIRLALSNMFGAEWRALSADDQDLIIRDCTTGTGVSDLYEYRQNIGAGNLQAYAKTQRVRFATHTIGGRPWL